MDKEGERCRVREIFKSDCNLYSGENCLGATPEIFADSVGFSHVARNGVEVLDCQNKEEVLKGGRPLTIY